MKSGVGAVLFDVQRWYSCLTGIVSCPRQAVAKAGNALDPTLWATTTSVCQHINTINIRLPPNSDKMHPSITCDYSRTFPFDAQRLAKHCQAFLPRRSCTHHQLRLELSPCVYTIPRWYLSKTSRLHLHLALGRVRRQMRFDVFQLMAVDFAASFLIHPSAEEHSGPLGLSKSRLGLIVAEHARAAQHDWADCSTYCSCRNDVDDNMAR
jgi:hypothetical protein